jgi:hypothetical protein
MLYHQERLFGCQYYLQRMPVMDTTDLTKCRTTISLIYVLLNLWLIITSGSALHIHNLVITSDIEKIGAKTLHSFSDTISFDCVTLKTKSIVVQWTIVGRWFSVQRHCTHFIIHHWPWLRDLENEIDFCSVDHCWSLIIQARTCPRCVTIAV